MTWHLQREISEIALSVIVVIAIMAARMINR